MRNFLWMIGLVCFMGSLFLAFQYEYKHFYELLVIGMLLMMNFNFSLIRLSLRAHIALYLAFFTSGVIVDLVLAQWIGKLWFYNYEALWEYLSLYFIVYPVAGYVMLLTYLIGLRALHKHQPPPSPQNSRVEKLSYLAIVFCIVLLSVTGPLTYLSLLQMAIFAVIYIAILFVSYITEKLHGQSFFLDIANNKTVLLVILLGTLINLLLHEVPNINALQWVYTATTGTVLDVKMFGIQFGFWLAWPSLLLGPVALYYLVVKISDLLRQWKASIV